MTGNIYLMGFMGSGKTSAGRALAKKLGLPFTDTDLLARRLFGRPAADFIKTRGLAAWRKAERAALKTAARSGNRVVALGGGIMPTRALKPLFRKSGVTVYLKCGETVLFNRLKLGLARRPLLGGGPAKARLTITRLLKKRKPYYEQADLTVDAADLSPEKTAEKIIKLLPKYDKPFH
jgi:shikimate kinase